MNFDTTEMAEAAVNRYGMFLNILRGQADMLFRRGPTDEGLRNEALSVAQGAARSFLSLEQAHINEDTADVARSAYKQAMSDLALPELSIENRFADFLFESAYFTTRIIAAQAERDIMTMAQNNQGAALRIDMYVRTGRHNANSAAAQVMIEDQQSPAFRFVDRMGRKFKTSKHIRDLYRLQLTNAYNEVYMDVVASNGHESVYVGHPNPDYKWFGEELAIVSGGKNAELPLYYDVKDEIFHPSSDATLTIIDPQE